jgi:transcriptional regulator of acetoin/glycerol metabolism
MNEVERALILGDDRARPGGPCGRVPGLLLGAADAPSAVVEAAERALIERVLAESGGNVIAAARVLGVSRSTLYRRITRYKLASD